MRKGAIPILTLSAICSTVVMFILNKVLFADIIDPRFDFSSFPIFIFFGMFLILFMAAFGAIYDIAHKEKPKANKYLLGGSLSAIVMFLASFIGIQYSSILLYHIFVVSFISWIILMLKAQKYEKLNQ